MIARLHHGAQRRNRRHSRAEAVRRRSTFQRAKALLQRIARRIRQSSIFMALILADRLLLIRRGQVDRHVHGAG